MKNLIISIVLLVIIAAVLFFYGTYTNETARVLSSFTQSEEITSENALSAYEYWLSRRWVISLGVDASYTENVTIGFTALRAALESGDSAEAEKAQLELGHFIGRLALWG